MQMECLSAVASWPCLNMVAALPLMAAGTSQLWSKLNIVGLFGNQMQNDVIIGLPD